MNKVNYVPKIQVLYVEDNPKVYNPFVKEILKRGIFIYHVDNLADAIEIVKKCKIDLIVSDGMFPKKKGMKEEKNFIPLLEVLEKNKVNTPVIAWANSTHVHEYCKKNKLPSYSKIKVTHEMFERRGRKYFPVPLKNHLEIADLVEEKLIEASNLKKVLSKYIFSEYYKEPITVLGAFMAAEMRTKMFKQTSGRNYGPIIFEMNKGLGRCLVDDKDDKKIALSIFNKIEKQNFFPEIRREVNLRAKKLSVFSKILRETNYSKLSNEELAKMYLKFVELFMQMRIYSSLPTAMEHETNTWTEYLKTILKPKIKDVSEYNKVFSTLTTPIKASYLNRYEVDVAQLGELKYSGKLTEKKVGEIVKKWAFVNFTFEGVPITAKDIYNKMKVLGKNTRDFSDFLKEQEERPRKIELLKKEFFKKYNFSKKEKEMFEIGADIVFIKYFRKGIFAESYYSVEFLLMAIAKRLDCTKRQVANMLAPEVLAGLKLGSFPQKIINQRIANGIAVSCESGSYFFRSEKTRELFKEKVEDDVLISDLIKGQTAYAGKVVGKVVIVNAIEEIKKIHVGDILVARSTNPALLPAMRSSGAIVTDIGGLTCHAAIVAREMKKPCIVGTKIATQVLKDGDIVEVDASNGIVKKIK